MSDQPLWSPSPERVEATQVMAFLRETNRRHQSRLQTYRDLHAWSVQNPDLFWDADPTHAKAKIPPGPNSPVGVVWVDINKEHFGLHGTPEPGTIGRTESHGCIRLTNWDATELAKMVKPGVTVQFTE